MQTFEAEPILLTKPIGKARRVKLPNGIVIFSHWYSNPKPIPSTLKEVQAMDRAYRDWLDKRNRGLECEL